MYYLHVEVFTQEYLGRIQFCKEFIDLLQKYSFEPDKIGLYEPLKNIYSKDELQRLWMIEDGTEDYCCNMLTGVQKKNGIRFDTYWSKGVSARLGSLVFWFSKKYSIANKDVLLELLKDLIVRFNAVYGSISTWDRITAQHVTGTLQTRIPGIFWINYFGEEFNLYLNFNDITQINGICCTSFYKGKVLQIDDNFYGNNCTESFEEKMKNLLGKNSFGDIVENRADFEKLQIKNVPQWKIFT